MLILQQVNASPPVPVAPTVPVPVALVAPCLGTRNLAISTYLAIVLFSSVVPYCHIPPAFGLPRFIVKVRVPVEWNKDSL